MDLTEAKELLAEHAGGGDPSNEGGFILSLRPYRGLKEENFHAVMHALLVAMQSHPTTGPLDREVVEPLWFICHTARHWALRPSGMLQRNDLISEADAALLREWVDVIEATAIEFVCGVEAPRAALEYGDYVAKHGAVGAPDLLVELLAAQVREDDFGDTVESAAKALTRFGPRAAPALPALRVALGRAYTYAEPNERVTADIHAVVQDAIAAIEAT